MRVFSDFFITRRGDAKRLSADLWSFLTSLQRALITSRRLPLYKAHTESHRHVSAEAKSRTAALRVIPLDWYPFAQVLFLVLWIWCGGPGRLRGEGRLRRGGGPRAGLPARAPAGEG